VVARGYAPSAPLSVLSTIPGILLRTLPPRPPAARALGVELLVLRHENRVLRRQRTRTRWCPVDRVLLVALSRCLPRAERARFPVWPETLLPEGRPTSGPSRPDRCRGPAPPPRPGRPITARLLHPAGRRGSWPSPRGPVPRRGFLPGR